MHIKNFSNDKTKALSGVYVTHGAFTNISTTTEIYTIIIKLPSKKIFHKIGSSEENIFNLLLIFNHWYENLQNYFLVNQKPHYWPIT